MLGSVPTMEAAALSFKGVIETRTVGWPPTPAFAEGVFALGTWCVVLLWIVQVTADWCYSERYRKLLFAKHGSGET